MIILNGETRLDKFFFLFCQARNDAAKSGHPTTHDDGQPSKTHLSNATFRQIDWSERLRKGEISVNSPFAWALGHELHGGDFHMRRWLRGMLIWQSPCYHHCSTANRRMRLWSEESCGERERGASSLPFPSFGEHSSWLLLVLVRVLCFSLARSSLFSL